jgi:hypothetical protein
MTRNNVGAGTWPHQFTKRGEPKQIGEEEFTDNIKRPILAQQMVCVHCTTEYTKGVQPQPGGMCPARHDKREMKRIKS